MKQRKHADRVMSNLEIQHDYQDRASTIDAEFDEAYSQINWERRNKASQSFVEFVKTYFIGQMIDDAPSPMFEQVLAELEFAVSQSTPTMLCLPRGSGKSSAAEMLVLYLIATGRKKFTVIVAQNQKSANNMLRDIYLPVMEKDTAFSTDFVELCTPFQLCNGSVRRRQLYRGISTDLEKNVGSLRFARLVDDDGNELPTSGSVIATRGISSGVRGMKVGTLRPDLVILDDLQTAETAQNPEQVEKIMSIINKDIMNLSSKGKITTCMTATPLNPEDLVDRIINNPQWKTTKYRAIINWPHDIIEHPDDGLWAQYFKIFDNETIDDKPHDGSLAFYKEHQAAMDDGAILFQPDKFKPEDGHISGLQALLEKRHLIGKSAFQAEMQMSPTRVESALNITPNIVASKIAESEHLVVPDGFVYTTAAIDLNTSYALTYNIVSFKPDMTSRIIYHDIMKVRIDQKLSDAQYNLEVYKALTECCKRIKLLGVGIDGLAIDAGGKNYTVVCDFAKRAMRDIGLPCCAFMGRSSNMFNPLTRSRLREEVNRTLLCGSPEEHVKAGAGQKYVFFDADFYKEQVQRALLQPVGSAGSCSLYKGDAKEHSEFAIQVCNEKLLAIVNKKDGRRIYTWKSKNDHDFLDTMAMCYAVAGQNGISGGNISSALGTRKPRRILRKKRIKII